jgi:signal transduction histidine kinase
MSIINNGTEPFRPYARLISILGDQLISNKWVGVIELVKNCYDADAEKVTIRFLNFDKDSLPESRSIEIEDDGDGMELDTVLTVWMKPATPNKLNKKKSNNRYTRKGRIMQGDKGVGRFAVYKLGNYIELYTKTKKENEVKVTVNFREYTLNNELEIDNSDVDTKFLDEITNSWVVNDTPQVIKNKKNQGTLIRISDLRNEWKEDDLKKLMHAFYKMIPPIIPGFEAKIERGFIVDIDWNNKIIQSDNSITIDQLLPIAPYSFQGSIEDDGKFTYIYRHNKKEIIDEINLFEDIEHDVKKLKLFKEQFLIEDEETKGRDKWVVNRKPKIGELNFFFYAFDLTDKIHSLNTQEKDVLKDNSVYLYRDYTRVYPYGEKGQDWLMLSKLRAEDRAGSYFSYNDLLGFVFISQEKNPKLRDSADREGLMNIDGAYEDFVALMQAGLKVMKDFVDVDKRKDALKREKPFISANKGFSDAYLQLKDLLAELDDKKLLDKSQKLFKATNNLVQQYKEKLSISNELAGVGMAVEKSSHDTYSLLTKLQANAKEFSEKFESDKVTKKELQQFFVDLADNLEFLYQELQILQPLFRVARKVTKDISINDVAKRVKRYFRKELEGNIEFTIDDKLGDVVVKTNTGLILQTLINLTDNSIYWLNQSNIPSKEIVLTLDAENNKIIFSDNGPGIKEDLKEVVFMEFYSTKSEGRGLGLYIINELLDRINATISIITIESEKILSGANFLIQFENE